jgi:hypothetical protein
MQHPQLTNMPTKDRLPDEWARLIHKLRWIGADDEANNLLRAVRCVPPEQRGAVSEGLMSTD